MAYSQEANASALLPCVSRRIPRSVSEPILSRSNDNIIEDNIVVGNSSGIVLVAGFREIPSVQTSSLAILRCKLPWTKRGVPRYHLPFAHRFLPSKRTERSPRTETIPSAPCRRAPSSGIICRGILKRSVWYAAYHQREAGVLREFSKFSKRWLARSKQTGSSISGHTV
jgi:hypothetical protein